MIAGMLAGAAGIVVATRLTQLPDISWLALVLPAAAVAACWRHPVLRVSACLALGLAWGCLRGHEMLARALPTALEGRDVPVRLCIEGLPLRREDARGESWRLRARMLEPLPGAVGPLARWQGRRVEFSWYGAGEFRPGEAWAMVLRLRAPRGFVNPGGHDYQAWLLGQGIDATGYAVNKAPHRRLEEALPCGATADRWRYRLRARLERLLAGEPQLGKLLALTIGDAARFTPADWELFARTGTTHLMVISGMHITLVAMLVMGLAGVAVRLWPRALLRLPARSWGMLAAFPATLAYGALAGMGVSVQRALLMVAVLFLFGLRERHLRPWLAWVMALLAVLVVQPLAAMQVGFWLSFITVGALLLAYAGRVAQPSRWQLLWRPQVVVAVALWCPLLLAGQSQAPLAPLVNAVAIPLADLVVVPAALAGCLLLALGDGAAWPLLKLALLGLEVLDWLLERAAAHSPALPAPAPATDAWRIALAALGTAWLLLPRGFPGRLAGAALTLPLVLPARTPPLLELQMLDVGQGTAVIVRTAAHVLVYDAGPRFSERFEAGGAIVVPALARNGARHIDALVLSHADSDHAGGAAGLLGAMPVTEQLGGEPVAGVALQPCERGRHWQWDGVDFTVLHPPSGARIEGNERSCVLRVAAAGRAILLAGDIESGAEAMLLAGERARLPADVLLVPHHGSRSSSGAAFVAAVAPRYALVSAGHRNRFGHPHPDVVARYRATGAEILETARHGAVVLRIDADGVIAPPERWRIDHRRFWYAP